MNEGPDNSNRRLTYEERRARIGQADSERSTQRELATWTLQQLEAGTDTARIATAIVEQGLTTDIEEAHQYVLAVGEAAVTQAKNAVSEAREEKRSAVLNHLLWAAIWGGGGGLLTLATYLGAKDNAAGWTYYVFWGGMIYGAIRLLQALIATVEWLSVKR